MNISATKEKVKEEKQSEGEKMSTQARPRNAVVDEFSCVPETQQSQQAAGLEELVVGVEDHLEMSDTEQGDKAP